MTALIAASVGYVASAAAWPDAGSYAFCPPYVDSYVVITSGSRCVSDHAVVTDGIDARHEGGTSVNMCLLLKAQSDGGGATVSPGNACFYTGAISNHWGYPITGWATIINQSGDAHYQGEYHPR